MSQQSVQEQRCRSKKTPTEVRNNLREQYRNSKNKGIEIEPPKISRKPSLYRTARKKKV